MKRSVRLFLSECKVSIITPHTLHGPVQTTQTAFPKPTDSPDPAIKSIICSYSLLLLPAVSLCTSLLTIPRRCSPKLRHHFCPFCVSLSPTVPFSAIRPHSLSPFFSPRTSHCFQNGVKHTERNVWNLQVCLHIHTQEELFQESGICAAH